MLGSRAKVPEEIAEKFRQAATRHKDQELHHMHKRTESPISLGEVPANVRKEMLSDWHSVSKRTSKTPTEDFPDVKE